MANPSDKELNIKIQTTADTSGASKVDTSIKAVGQTVKNVGESAATAAKQFAGLAGLGSLGALAKQAFDFADGITDAAARTGIATDDLQKLDFAAKQSGTNLRAVEMGLKELARGAATNVKEFDALGIATRELDGSQRNVRAMLDDVADRLAATSSQAERTALAVRLLGQSGADLVPLLQGGSAGLRAMGNEAQRLGQVMNSEAVAALAKAKDNIEAFQKQVTVLTGTGLGWFLDLAEKSGIAAGALIYGTEAAVDALDSMTNLDQATRSATLGKIADTAATEQQTAAYAKQKKEIRELAGQLSKLREEVAALEFDALPTDQKISTLQTQLADVQGREVKVDNPAGAETQEEVQTMVDALEAKGLEKKRDTLQIEAKLRPLEEQTTREKEATSKQSGSAAAERERISREETAASLRAAEEYGKFPNTPGSAPYDGRGGVGGAMNATFDAIGGMIDSTGSNLLDGRALLTGGGPSPSGSGSWGGGSAMSGEQVVFLLKQINAGIGKLVSASTRPMVNARNGSAGQSLVDINESAARRLEMVAARHRNGREQ